MGFRITSSVRQTFPKYFFGKSNYSENCVLFFDAVLFGVIFSLLVSLLFLCGLIFDTVPINHATLYVLLLALFNRSYGVIDDELFRLGKA